MWEFSEKLLVVVLALLLIFAGLAAWLFYLERRLRRTEKKLEERFREGGDSSPSQT